ncbi:MAG TPA: sugar porter family MFS transporter [Steroidobacteraceae bacterium]|nr:sugar porter family MFS transporter [Steroidobacteraceae bacterium]
MNLRYVLFLACTAATGGLLFGFDVAIISGAGPFLARHFQLGDFGLGVAFSSLLFGCAIGSAIAGRLSDRYGRRYVLLWIALLFAFTSVVTAIAWDFPSFLAARFIGGVAVGGVSLVSPMYISEVAPAAVRGRLGALYQMSIVTGILVSYCINYLLHDIGPDNWRWMFGTGVIPSVIFFALLLRAPETPRFLFMAGRHDEARAVMHRLGDSEYEVSLAASAPSLPSPASGGGLGWGRSWREMFQPGVRRAVFVGFWLAILVHFSGINTVIDYAPAIFLSAGWQLDAALLSTFVVGLTNFLFTLVAFWTIDRYGRRPLYIAGSLGMAAMLAALTIAVLLGHFRGPLVLILILGYLICFCSCIGPVFWTLMPEILPTRIRGTAMIVPVLTQWVANAVVVLLFPAALHQLGQAPTFAILGAFSLAQALFTWKYVPETKNRTLEEIEEHWART